jgi:DNA (cytosine-5)-methyltransferase 1
MTKYTCETCQKVFSQKGHLEDHNNRKRPCKKDNTIEALVEKKVQEVLSKTNEGAVKIDSTTTTIMQSNQMDYSTKTREELIALCKEKKIKGYSDKKKEDITKLLMDSQPKNEIITPANTEPVVQITEQPTFIEVCAGCGGLSSGFIEAGFKPLLINEIDKTFCKTLRKNHPGVNVVEASMVDLDLKSYKGKVDVLQGGVPCQAFSQAGERKGLDDPRGKLIVQFNKLINDCEPKVFIVENVKGLTTHNKGETLKGVLSLFENNGKYKVYHKVLNAKDYEVPQKRERILIVGVHSSISKTFTYPEKSKKIMVLKDVLSNVPPSIGAIYPEHKANVMKLVPQGGCWINLPQDIQKSYMGEKGLAAGGGKRGIARRLAMNEQSLTLTTSPCQKQTERCHPIENRPLNVREYARIQTFPDSYVFEGSMGNQYKQIGNAVPVKLALAMGKQIKQFLEQS